MVLSQAAWAGFRIAWPVPHWGSSLRDLSSHASCLPTVTMGGARAGSSSAALPCYWQWQLRVLAQSARQLGLKRWAADGGDTVPDQKTKGLQWTGVPLAYRMAFGLVYVAFGFSYIIYMTFFTKHLIAEGDYTQDRAGDLFMTMAGSASLRAALGTVSDVIVAGER